MLGLVALLGGRRRLLEQSLRASLLSVGDAQLDLERRDVRVGLTRPRGGGLPLCDERLPVQHERNRVHHSYDRVLGEAVAFLEAEREKPAADLRGDGHLGRLEVAVGVDLVLVAGREDGEDGEDGNAA